MPDAGGPTNKDRQSPGWGARLLLAPMVAWLVVFVVAPTAVLLIYSFCRRGELQGQIEFTFTLENYRRVFERTYLRIFLLSLYYAAVTTVACVLIGYPVAYFIGKSPPRWRNVLLILVMIPFWTSFLIRTYAWMAILNEHGVLNSLLLSTGLTAKPLDILYTPTAVIIGLVYTYLPFMILPIYASVEKLDDALIEAAFDLGATPLRAFCRVILPLTWPGIAAGVLLVFVPAIGMFAVSDLLGGGRVPLIGNVIQNQFGQAGDWPFGSALGIALMALFAVGYYFAVRKGLVTGRGET